MAVIKKRKSTGYKITKDACTVTDKKPHIRHSANLLGVKMGAVLVPGLIPSLDVKNTDDS